MKEVWTQIYAKTLIYIYSFHICKYFYVCPNVCFELTKSSCCWAKWSRIRWSESCLY